MVVKGYDLDVVFTRVKRSFVLAAISVGFLYASYLYNKTINRQNARRQEIVCPSFLSIARSARDTLIVMRNEPLCNRYVLNNLQ
jgi:ABC-type iron transport system FetAB permease component